MPSWRLDVIITVRDIAAWVEGEVVGDPAGIVRAAKPLSDSPGAEDITVVLDEKFLSQFHASEAGAAVVDQSVPLNGKTLVRVKDPLMAFVTIIQRLHGSPVSTWFGIHPTAVIHPTASIGPDARIGPHVTIGEGNSYRRTLPVAARGDDWPYCELGDDVAFGPQVVVYDRCVIGDRVIMHANAVIGADGFGFRMVKADNQGATGRQCRNWRRRGDRRLHNDRSGDLRHDANWRRHETRQSRADRAQLPDRQAQRFRGTCRHCRLRDDRRLRGDGRPGRDRGSLPDRRPAMLGAKCGIHKDVPADARCSACRRRRPPSSCAS